MAIVQIRDVPERTLRTLRAQAAERGLSLASYLRGELDRIASRPTNAEVVARLRLRDRAGGPATAETVDEIRRTREMS